MITFPSLGLSFNVKPVAFKMFGINIYYYAICIVLGIIISLLLCYKSKERFNISFDFVLETLLYSLIFGFIGARIYYVLFNLNYYMQSPIKVFYIRDGGLALYGGLIAGALFIIKRCKKYKVDLLNFFDYIVPFVSIAQCIGRWGNFFNCEAYGTETLNLFRMGINTLNGYKEVHPVFLYESISTLIIFIILRILQKNRKFKGEVFLFYLLLYSEIRIILEGLRIDSLMIRDFKNFTNFILCDFCSFQYNAVEKIQKNTYLIEK